MIHILCRTIKRILNEEIKLKSQVPTKIKPSTFKSSSIKSLADHQNSNSDHFMGNQQETFRDNLVFFLNTLLRRKFSKQKHVFDETLIGLFLCRLKAIPIVSQMVELQKNLDAPLISDWETNYVTGKSILDDVIAAPSQNPALFLNSIQAYFNIEIEQEFTRKSRQDKFLFLSQLNSSPMILRNMPHAHPKFSSYFSVREFAYFMLANQVYKQHTEQATQQQRFTQIEHNQSLRQNVFMNRHSQKNSAADLSVHMAQSESQRPSNLRIDVNSSMMTDKFQLAPPQARQTPRQTPRQFTNIDALESRHGASQKQPKKEEAELIMPSILYKLDTSASVSSVQGHKATSNLLPYYKMPNQDVFNTWVMYLESILREVFSIEGSEQVLLEAYNYLAINIYFGEALSDSFFNSVNNNHDPSPLLNSHRDSLSSNRLQIGESNAGYDHDSFTKVCMKIKDIQAFVACCSPEVLAMSQIVCALNFEQVIDDTIFPIEAEKSYLTALICLFHSIGDPRGRGNHSVAMMLLITWKLSLLSLCTENRKVHDSEFAEELFDAVLANLPNHKVCFREHMNSKLYRADQESGLKRTKSGNFKSGGSA